MFDRTMHLSTNWVRAKAHLGPASVGLVSAYIIGAHSFDSHRVNNPHRRNEIAMTGLSLPPDIAMTPHELWHWADRKERRKDGAYQMRSRELPRLASHMRCSLPWSLTPEAAERVTVAFARFLTEKLGLGVQYAIHNKPEHERDHAHFLMTTRSLAPENFGKKVRELDGIATRKREAGTAAEIRYTRANGSEKSISSTIEDMRAYWAELLSSELGFTVDHRSFERRGLDLDPVIYVPRSQIEFEKRQAKRGAAAPGWRAQRAAQLARRSRGNLEAEGHKHISDRSRVGRWSPHDQSVIELGLQSVCEDLTQLDAFGGHGQSAVTARARLAEGSPLIALAVGIEVIETTASRDMQTTVPTVGMPSHIPTDPMDSRQGRSRQKRGAQAFSQFIDERGQEISSACSISSQQADMQDAIRTMGQINPVVALGTLALIEEMMLDAQNDAERDASSFGPSKRRSHPRMRGVAEQAEPVAKSMAMQARYTLETELDHVDRGLSVTNDINVVAARLAAEMEKRNCRLSDLIRKRHGSRSLEHPVVQDAMVEFARRLETYRQKSIEALRGRYEGYWREEQHLASQARLDLASVDLIPTDNAMVKFQVTDQIDSSFQAGLERTRLRRLREMEQEIAGYVNGGPQVRSGPPELTPAIVSSGWERPTAMAAPVGNAVDPMSFSPLTNDPRPVAQVTPTGSAKAGRRKPSLGFGLNVPAILEREELGILDSTSPSTKPLHGSVKASVPPRSGPLDRSLSHMKRGKGRARDPA